jgi:hypothetical protein
MKIIKLLLLLFFAQNSFAQINKNDHLISGYFTYWNLIETGTINQNLRYFETKIQYTYFPLEKFYLSAQLGFIPYLSQEYSMDTRISSGSHAFPMGISIGYYHNFENKLTLLVDLNFRYMTYFRKDVTFGLNGNVNSDIKTDYKIYNSFLFISLNYFISKRFAVNGTIQLLGFSKFYSNTTETNTYGFFEYDYTGKSISINSIFGIPQIGVSFRLNKND